MSGDSFGMGNLIDALDLVRTISAAPSSDEAVQRYQSYLGERGYEEFSYGLFRDAKDFSGSDDFIYLSNYRPCVADVFLEFGLQHDVTLQHCFKNTTPFWWRDPEPTGPGIEGWSDTEKRFIRTCEDVGVKNGVSIPIHVAGNGVGAFTLKRAQNESDTEHRLYWQERSREIELSAWIFHFAVDKSSLLERHRRLTTREVDVLSYLASGMTQQQTAAHLDRHLRTVEDIIRSARRKLSAKTTAQAVAKAVASGIVKP